MPKLRIKADDGKTLVIDVTGYDPSDYDELAVAANEDYMSGLKGPKHPIPADVENEPGLIPKLGFEQVGTMTKAGGAGIGDLVSGKGLQQAATDVENVEIGKTPETTAGKVGSAVGGLVTPEQIALQGGLGAALTASGFGPWVAGVMKGWGESAALSAIGIIKKIATGIGLENIDALAQFLLKPVKIGAKELPAIVQATSDTKDMLAAAKAIQNAAGAALGKISPVVDDVVASNPEALNLQVILNNLQKMREAVARSAPNLGKEVVNQYQKAIDDFVHVIKNSWTEANPALFSDLRALKTTIGNLVYKHGNPLESKAALEEAYAAISEGIDSAAKAASPAVGAAFNEANAVYNKVTAIVEALSNKAISAVGKSFFTDLGSMGVGALAGFLNPAMAIPTAIGTHVARQYGPQAIAKGLNWLAPKAAPLIKAGVRSLPIAGSAIASALE